MKNIFKSTLKKAIILFSLNILLYSCMMDQKIDSRILNILNKSNEKVFYFESQNDSLNLPFKTEDIYNDSLQLDFYSIVKDDSTTFSPRGTWENYLSKCSNNKLRIFVIRKSLIDKYGWKIVKSRELYNNKFVLNVSMMDQLNWNLTIK
ncbi:MAG: hypothetical protein PHT07_07700 [Paludibacter sp.]|nr:hypothetical protein [Paludibacter sp.]